MAEFKRKLASVQMIEALEPIEGADFLELASLEGLGWHVVVKKGAFSVGELVCYLEVDSLVPADKPEFEFLAAKKFRIRTIRLRGCRSEGIIFKFNELSSYKLAEYKYNVGDDLTDALGIKHIDKVKEEQPVKNPRPKKFSLKYYLYQTAFKLITALTGPVDAMAPWPGVIAKSDESRIQHCIGAIKQRHLGKLCYVSEKMHGKSVTHYYNKGKTGVCSRNYELLSFSESKVAPWRKKLSGKIAKILGIKIVDQSNSDYWVATKKNKILEKLENYCKNHYSNLAIQSELCGPGINGNMYGFEDYRIFLFNIWDIDLKRYFDLHELESFCTATGVEMVPILGKEFRLHADVDKYVADAKGNSVMNPKSIREGFVIRPLIETKDPNMGRLSFKVISEDYLLKQAKQDDIQEAA